MLVGNLPYNGVIRSNLVLRMTNSSTNSANSYVALASDPKPATVADYMNFTGTQNIRYSDRPEWHVNAPYSVEMDCMMTDQADRWLGTVGEAFGGGWPEWSIVQIGGNLLFRSSSDNNGYTTVQTFITNYNINQWYRVGLMFYQDRVRGMVNNVKVFDIPFPTTIDSPNGIAFGGDYVKNAGRQFKGRLRNITVAQSLFWTV